MTRAEHATISLALCQLRYGIRTRPRDPKRAAYDLDLAEDTLDTCSGSLLWLATCVERSYAPSARLVRARVALYLRALLRAERDVPAWPMAVEVYWPQSSPPHAVDQRMRFYGPNAGERAANYARYLRLALPGTHPAFADGLHAVRVVPLRPLWVLGEGQP